MTKIPGYAIAAAALATAGIAAGFICAGLGFGQPVQEQGHCYGRGC